MIHTTTPFEEKQLTMNQLGEMIGRGFKEVHEDLMRVTGDLEERMSTRMDSMQKSMDSQFKETNSKISRLHVEVQDIKDGYATKEEHNHLRARVIRIERKVV